MQQAVGRGTGGRSVLSPSRPQAGKTGTHESYTDVWFVGFVPQYTAAVWVGFPDSQVEMRNITIHGDFVSRAYGGTVAAPIWRAFMSIVTADLPIEDFPPDPDGIDVYYQTPRAEVPEVVGMDIDEAEEVLLQAGFETTFTMINSDEDEDSVVTQDPEAGELIRQGTTVELEVSNGLSPETILPDLIGGTRQAARIALTNLRRETGIEFSWEFVEVAVTDPAEHNQVLSTEPGPGSTITEETHIVIRVTQLVAPGDD
jgi:membrane peptidoglycan carboxypeptidase